MLDESPATVRWPTAEPATLSKQAAHHELEDAVAAELDRLTLAQRGALELKSLGYSLDEIAEALGTSSSNAGVLVHRARQAARRAPCPIPRGAAR